MSAGNALRTMLAANGPVAALVGTRIAQDRIDMGKVRPFIVYAVAASQPFTCVDGTNLATLVTLEVQCWGDTRPSADAVADAVTAAVRGTPTQTVTGRVSAYDPELDLEGSILTVDWWE